MIPKAEFDGISNQFEKEICKRERSSFKIWLLRFYSVRESVECPFHGVDFAGFYSTVFPHSANVIQEISLRLLLQFAAEQAEPVSTLFIFSRKISRAETMLWLCDFKSFNVFTRGV